MKPPPNPREKNYQLELGTWSLLSMFAVLAVVCGWFFALGFTLGKHSVPATFSLGATAAAPASAAAPLPPLTAPPAAAPATPPVAPPNTSDLSAAESNQTPATLSPAPAGASAPAPAAPAPTPSSATPPVPASAAPGSDSYSVEVFAGSKESDALGLAAALKARQYPVFVLRPFGTEGTYRVEVGPYATMDEAQAMRARLSADGYNAVIKP